MGHDYIPVVGVFQVILTHFLILSYLLLIFFSIEISNLSQYMRHSNGAVSVQCCIAVHQLLHVAPLTVNNAFA